MVVHRQDVYRLSAFPFLPFASPGLYSKSLVLNGCSVGISFATKKQHLFVSKARTVGLLLKLKKDALERLVLDERIDLEELLMPLPQTHLSLMTKDESNLIDLEAGPDAPRGRR